LLERTERRLKSIQAFYTAWAELPPVVRFESIRLSGQQASQTREVLAIEISMVSFAQRRVRKLSFQLQATPQAGDTLGMSSYLIFPRETATQPFEVWIGTAKDASANDVMALPFEADGRNRALWRKLSSSDVQFIVSLCEVLPFAISMLSRQGARINRGWAGWIELAKQLRAWATIELSEPVIEAPAAREDDNAMLAVEGESESFSEPANTDAPPPVKPKRVRKKPTRRTSVSEEARSLLEVFK
jgi:hypothetical protein